MEKQKRFIRLFFIEIAVMLALFIAAVVFVDPFFHYHEPLGGLKAVATKPEHQVIGSVRNFEYDSIILGSSVAENYNNRWFDETFGGTSIKAIQRSATTVELVYYLNEALKEHELKNVYYALDIASLKDDPSQKFPDATMPLYLYNENVLDDIKYVFNKDVIFEDIPYMMAVTLLEDYDEGTSYNWAQYKTFSKEGALRTYNRLSGVLNMKPAKDCEETVRANLNMLEQIVKEEPRTKFRFIFSPYSMLWWDDCYRNGELKQNLYATRLAAETLLAYDNVEIYYFQNDTSIVTDLDNYMDVIHFSDVINHYIVDEMGKGNYQLTLENYEEEIAKMEALAEQIVGEYILEYYR